MNLDSQDSQVYNFVYAASFVLTFTGNSVEFTWMKSEEISPQAPIPQDVLIDLEYKCWGTRIRETENFKILLLSSKPFFF